jgi:hypothetical protein
MTIFATAKNSAAERLANGGKPANFKGDNHLASGQPGKEKR